MCWSFLQETALHHSTCTIVKHTAAKLCILAPRTSPNINLNKARATHNNSHLAILRGGLWRHALPFARPSGPFLDIWNSWRIQLITQLSNTSRVRHKIQTQTEVAIQDKSSITVMTLIESGCFRYRVGRTCCSAPASLRSCTATMLTLRADKNNIYKLINHTVRTVLHSVCLPLPGQRVVDVGVRTNNATSH